MRMLVIATKWNDWHTGTVEIADPNTLIGSVPRRFGGLALAVTLV
jgi:hypothetical protein